MRFFALLECLHASVALHQCSADAANVALHQCFANVDSC
ncbi:hypothetical protein CGSMWGv00703Dmash_00805 [Gardnerella greenwoodii 00703Dmash]|uniref:Uncharacterized protein n=1 Tax=Gardnerella greenwoodii 00703Dmash TaxID=698960 RepID=I4MB15_9BIFI|nr:hypothetical protein CGSMWGv00703Dmash_00805 [Gardnerella greenwoodii 00703Dmash]